MSNFSDVLDGLETALKAGITGLQVYKGAPDDVKSFPAAILLPEPFDPRLAFSGNSWEGEIRIILLISSGKDENGWAQLWDYIDPTTATKSVIKAIEDDRALNAKVDDSEITRIENIGRREIGGGFQFGFDALLHYIKSVA